MSEEDDSGEVNDGLECFQFKPLIDDVKSTNQKARKVSYIEPDDEEDDYLKEIDSVKGFLDLKEAPTLSFRSEFERHVKLQNHREYEDSPGIQEMHIGATNGWEESASQQETRSECADVRKTYFNIWGEHKVRKDKGFSKLFGVHGDKLREARPSGYSHSDVKKPRLASHFEANDLNSPSDEKKKKSLRYSKCDEFHPTQPASATHAYRKLSYQETPIKRHTFDEEDKNQPLNIRQRLNLDSLGLSSRQSALPAFTPQTWKFASFVREDVNHLVRVLEEQVECRLRSQDNKNEFPMLSATLINNQFN